MILETDDITRSIVDNLTDDLRKPEYRGHPNPLYGHCYVASEAYFHLSPNRSLLKVMRIKHEGTTHWFLKNLFTGEFIDITAGQFKNMPDHSLGVGTGFLTKQPSKRAQELIRRVWNK